MKLSMDDLIRVVSWMFRLQDREVIRPPHPEDLRRAFNDAVEYATGKPASLDFELEPLFANISDVDSVERLAQEGVKKTLKSLPPASGQTGDTRGVCHDIYAQLVPDERGVYSRGDFRNSVLALQSLEKLAILLGGKGTPPEKFNFRTQLIVPVAEYFLIEEEYVQFLRLLELYDQTGFLQRGVRSVIHDDPDLFKGVEFKTYGRDLPQFSLERDKSTFTSIVQKSQRESDPTYWEILTQVEGKPYWGLKPFKREEGGALNDGMVTTSSLNMALRLAQAANQGNKKLYRHALMYIIESP
ncbi:hypothetical protein HYX03_03290 [Candidatus Woesearchaeota archaeon]|nr:hypothetical protein [Candidatus Woesearchaeota archaeon]